MTPKSKTAGVHPKVINPTLAGVLVGLGLIVFGEKDTGIAVLLAAVGYGGIGAASPAGKLK